MKSTAKYVGLDVHQATTVASVRDEQGHVIMRSIVSTDAGSLVEFCQGMRGRVAVALEEGTQAQWIHDVLTPVVDRIIVCDRRGASVHGNKADQSDADELADLLRCGRLRAVYHGSPERTTLKELARTYLNVTEDNTRVMLRLKALFRARGIRTPGRAVYRSDTRGQWLAHLIDAGVRFRADTLYTELAVLQQLRPNAKRALLAAAAQEPAWAVLRSIPFLGPVRVALLLATLQTPWRFRTKRHLWSYAGLAVVTRITAEYGLEGGRPVRRRRAPRTRGLNRNHNRIVKGVLKAAATAAASRSGPLQDYYEGMVRQGMRPELARVTLTRKLAALMLRLWKTGEVYDPTKLSVQAH